MTRLPNLKTVYGRMIELDYLLIADGQYPGIEIVHKFGHNDSIGTSLIALSTAETYQMPVAATALEIISSDAGDTAAGAGAQKVLVIGLDANFEEIEEEVTLNGLSAVNLTKTFTRVFRTYVTESGTYATLTASSHIGVIDVQTQGAGVIWARINGSGVYLRSQSQIGAYTIPAGKTGFLLNTFIHIDSGKTVDLLLFARAGADVVTAPFTANRIKTEFRGVQGSQDLTLKTPRRFEEKTDLMWFAKVDVTAADAAIDFELLIIDQGVLV